MTVVTAITAQNTQRVRQVFELPAGSVEAQVEAIAEDLPVDAVKTGMLASAAIIEVVARQVRKHGFEKLVVDPVMIASSGDSLLDPSAVDSLVEQLFPLASLITPNLREAEVLSGETLADLKGLERAARKIRRRGTAAVLIKGGHFDDPRRSVDYLFDGAEAVRFSAPRHATPHTHGSGCTLAAAICAFLARGLDLHHSVERAKHYVSQAIAASFSVGAGRGPLGHFHGWWNVMNESTDDAACSSTGGQDSDAK